METTRLLSPQGFAISACTLLHSGATAPFLRTLASGGYVNKSFLQGISGSMVSLLVRHLHVDQALPVGLRNVDEY